MTVATTKLAIILAADTGKDGKNPKNKKLKDSKPRRKAKPLMLEHDPEKWTPVFGKDHAQIKTSATSLIQH
jgi:hypothetical protein